MIKRPGSGKLRIKLVRDLSLVIVIATSAALFIIVNYSSELVRSISISHIQNTTKAAVSEFAALTQPVENNLKLINRWCQTGLVNIKNPEHLNKKLIPILELLPNISAIIIVSSNGREYFLMRDEDNWHTRITDIKNNAGQAIEKIWSKDYNLLESKIIKSDFDPRTRIWYKAATDSADENSVYWTQPFYFEIQKKLGISAAISSKPKSNIKETYVIAFDLPITRFYKMLASVKPSENGQTFLFLKTGDIFDISKLSQVSGSNNQFNQVFTPLEQAPASVRTEAIKIWKKDPQQIDRSFEFISDDQTWWGGIQKLNPNGGRVWMGTVLPEQDLIGQLYDFRYLVFLAIFMIVLIAIYLIARITRKYIRKIRQLPATRIDYQNIEEDIYAIIRSGEGKNVEFKSTMRMNLKTGKSGKEIEQAWLKSVAAFLNTDGGVLLIGVDDSGEILGTEADEFDNDDKCRLHFKNLLKQHIGLEYSEYINMDVYEVKDKKVVLVEVERSPNPAFLHVKEDEDFFIRSGPSSVKLPVSKVLTYLAQRENATNTK